MTGGAPPPVARSLAGGFWRLADPKISLASFAGLWLGCAAAARDGPIAWGWLAITVLGIFALEVAKNASGEVFDFDSGTDLAIMAEDRSPFSGGKRVLVDGLLSRTETWGIAWGAYAVAIACGLTIVLGREPAVLWLGVTGMALAVFYHAPPLRLCYRGLGELAVAVAYGPLVVLGTYQVQRGVVTPWLLGASVPLGLLIAAFLVANELPDRRGDAGAGKRTLVVRLGVQGSARLFTGVILAALAVALVLPSAGAPVAVWAGLLAGVPGLRAARRLHKAEGRTTAVIPAQTGALGAFLTYSAAAGLALVLTG